MGANKQSRFHGKDPRYKNKERTTLSDLLPAVGNRWDVEAEQFLEDRTLNNFREAFAPAALGTLSWNIPKQDVALTAEVKRYLEVRKAVDARKEANSIFPSRWTDLPEKTALPSAHHDDVERVEASRRDVLMELFVERKITAGRLHAGRVWQMMKEHATLQPSQSIDASGGGLHYQQRGEVTSGQWSAMQWRRNFIEYAGLTMTTMLDFCLEADRSRADIMRRTGQPAVIVEAMVEELLDKICVWRGELRAEAVH